jgi:hypothetical protein
MLCKLHVIKAGVYLGQFRNAGELLLVPRAADAAYHVKRKACAPADADTAERLAPLVQLERRELGAMVGYSKSGA